jgi:Pectate lyase superfamily protein
MSNYPYHQVGTSLGSDFRNKLNENFVDIEADIIELAGRINEGGGGSESVSNPVSVEIAGAEGNGVKDDTSAIVSTLNAASMRKNKRVYIPDGTYLLTSTLTIPRKVEVILGANAVLKPTGDFNIVQLKPESSFKGGVIDLQSITFTKAAFYLNAADVFQFYGQTHIVSDVNILGKVPATQGAFTGTGILLEAKSTDGFIDNVKFNNVTMINLDKCIHLRVDPSVRTAFNADSTKMAWINANYFHQITAQNFKYGIYLEGESAIPRDVSGNFFQCQFQAEATTENIIYCETANNIFDIFTWDVHKMDVSKPAIRFTKNSKFNVIYSQVPFETTESYFNEGYMNNMESGLNYVSGKPSLASRISTPYVPQFNGNQDDILIFGHHRGYTITQTSGPVVTGALNNMLMPNTEEGCTWVMTGTDYNNPVVIEVNMTSEPVQYLQFSGALTPYDKAPQGMLIEGWDGTKWIWLHEFKGNRSNRFHIAPPYSGVDNCTKLRYSFYGSTAADNKVVISRLFAISALKGGNFYQEQYSDRLRMVDANGTPRVLTVGTDGNWVTGAVGGNTLSGSIVPPASGDARMVGNQDDVLANLPKWASYTINLAKVAGEHVNMWDILGEKFSSYTAPTVAAPLIIEMDFSTSPISYLETIGIQFLGTESASNVKFEVVRTSGGTYTLVKDITGNTGNVVQVAYRHATIYKIRLTISEVNNTGTNRVKIGRIFATAGQSEQQAFVQKTGGVLHGGLAMAKVTALPIASSTNRGQMLRIEGATGVADKLYVCMKSATDTYSWVQIITG